MGPGEWDALRSGSVVNAEESHGRCSQCHREEVVACGRAGARGAVENRSAGSVRRLVCGQTLSYSNHAWKEQGEVGLQLP